MRKGAFPQVLLQSRRGYAMIKVQAESKGIFCGGSETVLFVVLRLRFFEGAFLFDRQYLLISLPPHKKVFLKFIFHGR